VRRVQHEQLPDSGLQNERTSLAWFRTSLSFAAVGALLLRASGSLDRPLPGVLGALALAFSAVAMLTSTRRYQAADTAIRHRRVATPPRGLMAATAALALILPVSLIAARLAGIP